MILFTFCIHFTLTMFAVICPLVTRDSIMGFSQNHVRKRNFKVKSRMVSASVSSTLDCGLESQSHQSWSKYVDQKVNLRNSSHAGGKGSKWGIHSGFETQGSCHQKSKKGTSVDPKKDLCPPKFYLKKKKEFKNQTKYVPLSNTHWITRAMKLCSWEISDTIQSKSALRTKDHKVRNFL